MFRSNQQNASVVPFNGDINNLPLSASYEQAFVQHGVYGGDFAIDLCEIGNKWDCLYRYKIRVQIFLYYFFVAYITFALPTAAVVLRVRYHPQDTDWIVRVLVSIVHF
jgi:hypothetical protein